jgi:hypothetical protein
MKQKEKQYFITVEVDGNIWGKGLTRGFSLKNARLAIKDQDDPEEYRGIQLKTYPTDKASYSVADWYEQEFTILKNGTLILNSVLEEQEDKAEKDRQERILGGHAQYGIDEQEFRSLSTDNKLTAIFLELKNIQKK